MKSFFINYLKLIADDQYNTSSTNSAGNDGSSTYGSIPDVVPFYRFGGRPADPSWSLAFPQIIYTFATLYNTSSSSNDSWITDLISEYIPNLMLYAANLNNRMPSSTNGGISKYPSSYGDWVPPPPAQKIDISFTGGWAYIEAMRILSTLANEINNETVVNYANSMMQSLIDQFITAWQNNTQYSIGIQTSFVIPLHSGIYNNVSLTKEILEEGLMNRIKNIDNSMITTGIIGCKFLFEVIDDILGIQGSQLSINMIKGYDNTSGTFGNYPSYLYESVNDLEPATAVWELWDAPNEGDGMNSRAHHMYSSVSTYLVENLGTIRQIGENKYEIHIGSVDSQRLKWANVVMDKIEYKWKWNRNRNGNSNSNMPNDDSGEFEMNLKVPIYGKVEMVFDILLMNLKSSRSHHDHQQRWWIVDLINDKKWMIKVNKGNIAKKQGEKLFEIEEEMIDFYGLEIVSMNMNQVRIVAGSGHYHWTVHKE